MSQTRVAAQGKWKGILAALGMTPQQLSGNHQPCPMCGGTDRWRYSDHDGHGSYFCSGCGPGSGFDLLMGINGWDFRTTAKEVDKLVSAGTISNAPFKEENKTERIRASLNNVWASAMRNTDLLNTYFKGRGLLSVTSELRSDLRYHKGLYLKEKGHKVPGMVALVRNKRGQPVSIHRTYFEPKARKMMPPTENLKGCSVRLGPTADHLVIGEGIETTLSGCLLFGTSGLAAISANLMEEVHVPDVARVTILADNDHSFTGQKAAFTLARRLDNRGIKTKVLLPLVAGCDFNDLSLDEPSPLAYLEFENVIK